VKTRFQAFAFESQLVTAYNQVGYVLDKGLMNNQKSMEGTGQMGKY
jgi:hypothetical protein